MRACLRRSHVLREHEWIASFARHANGQTSAERTPASLMPGVHGRRKADRRDGEHREESLSAGESIPSRSLPGGWAIGGRIPRSTKSHERLRKVQAQAR